MIHKFLISKSDDGSEITIEESAVTGKIYPNMADSNLSDRDFAVLCREKYDETALNSAIPKGKKALIDTLRTRNMYPTQFCADLIADSVTDFCADKACESIEILFENMELLKVSKNGSD